MYLKTKVQLMPLITNLQQCDSWNQWWDQWALQSYTTTRPSRKLPFECQKIAKNCLSFFSKKIAIGKKVPDLSHLELIWPSLGPSLTCLYHPPRVAGSHVDSASNGHAQRTDFNDLSKSELKKKKHDCILQWLDIWSVPFQL